MISIFKGTGFYETDYKKKEAPKSSSGASVSTDSSDKKTSTETKSAEKAGSKIESKKDNS